MECLHVCLLDITFHIIEDDEWKRCKKMPVPCSRYDAGVVVHEDRIKEITVDKSLTYADDTDALSVNDRLDTVGFYGATDSKESYQGRYGQCRRTMMAYTV